MGVTEYPLSLHLLMGLGLRLLSILYGEFHDWTMKVRYTDIDYEVFSDAARHMYMGQSPFLRHTYRYSPLLALMLVPNHTVCHLWGKFLFSVADVYVGLLIWQILRYHGFNNQCAMILSLSWLYNPFTINICTRGSADAILCALVLQVLICLQSKEELMGGLLYGFSVHFKIYPIIYAGTFFCSLISPMFHFNNIWNIHLHLKFWRFAFAFAAGFLLPTLACYQLYGDTYIQEAFLYHIFRQDFRHNFSPFFYFLYLSQPQTPFYSYLTALLTALPSFMVVVLVPFAILHRKFQNFFNFETSPGRVVLCLFIQTFLFVSFNKVCTSQYFLWYLPLLLILTPHLKMTVKRFSGLGLLWAVFQILWLFFAYHLEFVGMNTFLFLWITSLLFLLANVYLASQIITYAFPFSPPQMRSASLVLKIKK